MIILITLESQNHQACYYWHQLPLMGPAYWRPLLVSTAPPHDSPQDHTFEENTQWGKAHGATTRSPLLQLSSAAGLRAPWPPANFFDDPFKIDKKCHKIEGGELNRCLGNGVGLPLEQTISRLLQVPRACLPSQWEGPCLTMHSIIWHMALHCIALRLNPNIKISSSS